VHGKVLSVRGRGALSPAERNALIQCRPLLDQAAAGGVAVRGQRGLAMCDQRLGLPGEGGWAVWTRRLRDGQHPLPDGAGCVDRAPRSCSAVSARWFVPAHFSTGRSGESTRATPCDGRVFGARRHRLMGAPIAHASRILFAPENKAPFSTAARTEASASRSSGDAPVAPQGLCKVNPVHRHRANADQASTRTTGPVGGCKRTAFAPERTGRLPDAGDPRGDSPW
jgi:hypothetical protein